MIRRTLALVLSLAIILYSVPAMAAKIASDRVFTLTPSTTNVLLGQTFTAALAVEGTTPFAGVDVTVTFDPTKLQVVDGSSAKSGVQALTISPDNPLSLEASNKADNTAGTLNYASSNTENMSTTIPLGTITFHAIATGPVSIAFSNVQVQDIDSNDVLAAGNNLPVTIISPITLNPPAPFITNGSLTVTGSIQSGTGDQVAILVNPTSGTQAPTTADMATLSGTTFSKDLTLPTDGTYHLVAVLLNGGTEVLRVGADTVLDTQPPQISVTGAVDGQLYNQAAMPVRPVVSITDANLDVSTVHTTILTPGASAPVDFVAGTAYTADGSYVLTVTAADKAGNNSQRTVSFAIDSMVLPFTFSHNPDYITASNRTVSFALTSQEALSAAPTLTVTPPQGSGASTYTTAMHALSAAAWDASYTADVNPVQGEYAFAMTGFDLAGNSRTVNGTFHVDTVNPVITVTSQLPAITKATSLPVNFTVADANLATVKVGDTTLTANTDGSYTYNWTLAQEGPNGFGIVATDAAGNQSTQTVSVVLDTKAPEIVVTSQLPDMTNSSSVTVNFTATDLHLATVKVGETTLAANTDGSYTYNWTLPKDGENSFTITAVDAAGNERTQTVSIIRDITPPNIVSYSPGMGEYVGEKQPVITVTVKDDTTRVDDQTAGLTFIVNGVEFSDFTASASTESDGTTVFTITPTVDLPLQNGTAEVSLSFEAYDILGNVAVLGTETEPWTFHVDTNFPAVTATPGTAANTAGWYKASPQVTLTTADPAGASVHYALLPATTPKPDKAQLTDVYATPITVPEGEYNLWVSSLNANTDSWSPVMLAGSYKVDLTAPTLPTSLTVTTTGNKSHLTAGDTAAISVTSEAGLTAVYTITGVAQGTTSATELASGNLTATAGTYGVTCTVQAEAGVFTNMKVSVTVTDVAGNATTKVYDAGFTVDTVNPVIALTSEVPTVTAQPVALHFTVTDPNLATVKVGDTTLTANTDGSYTYTWTLAQEGNNTVSIVATDAAGNQTTQSLTTIRDTTVPEIRIVTDLPQRIKSNSVTVNFTATDLHLSTVKVGDTTLTAEQDGSYKFDWSLPADGLQTATITAVDAAGNKTTHDLTITRDMTPPEVIAVTPANGTYVGVKQPVITVTVKDAIAGVDVATSGLTMTVNGASFTSFGQTHAAGADGATVFTFTPTADLPLEGGLATVNLSFEAFDALENHQAFPWTFNIDTNFPAVAATPDQTANGAGWYKVAPKLALTTTTPANADVKYALLPATAAQPDQVTNAYTTPISVPEGQYNLWVSSRNPLTDRWSPVTQVGPTYKVDLHTPVLPATITVTKTGDKIHLKAGDTAAISLPAESGLTAVYTITGVRSVATVSTVGTPVTPQLTSGTLAETNGTYADTFTVPDTAGTWQSLKVNVTLTDVAGNTATQAYDATFDVDTDQPVITSISYSGITHPIKAGETVTLTVQAEAHLASLTKIDVYTADPDDPTVAVTKTGSLDVTESATTPGTYTATYTVADTTDRAVIFRATQADLAGNLADTVDTMDPVFIDVTKPLVKSVTIGTADGTLNPNNQVRYFKAGQVVTISVGTEPGLLADAQGLAKIALEIPGIGSISGLNWTLPTRVSMIAPTIYTATYTVPANVNTTATAANPGVPVQVTLTDAAGNVGTQTPSTQLVNIDTTAPKYVGVGVSATGIQKAGDSFKIFALAEPGLQNVHFSLNGHEGDMTENPQKAGLYEYTYSVTEGDNTAAGGAQVTVTFTDWAGNTAQQTAAKPVIIDTTEPDISNPTVNVPESGKYGKGDTLTVQFTGEPGLVTALTVDGVFAGQSLTAETANGVTTYSFSYTIGNNLNVSNASVTVAARDKAGNVKRLTAAQTVTIDTQPPYLAAALDPTANTVGLNGFLTADPVIKVNTEEGATIALTGVAAEHLTQTGPTLVNGKDQYSVTLHQDGPFTLTVTAADAAGNESTTTVSGVVDTTKPATPTITAPVTNAKIGARSVTVTGTVADADVTSVRVRVNDQLIGIFPVTGQAFSIANVPLYEDTKTGGANTIHVRAIDRAGNVSDATADVAVVRDTTPPTFAVTADQSAKTITVVASEPLSAAPTVTSTGLTIVADAAHTDTSTNTYGYTYTGTVPGTTLAINVTGHDQAGNTGSGSLVTAKVDTATGGTVNTGDGAVSANFGSNTLNGSDVTISSYLSSNLSTFVPPGTVLLGSAYEFHAQLKTDATVTVSFTVQMTGLVPAKLGIYYFPLDGNDLQTVLGDTQVISVQNGVSTVKVTATLPHFSVWAPLADVTPPTFTVAPTITPATYVNAGTANVTITGSVDSTAASVKAFLGGSQVGSTLTLAPAATGPDQPISLTIARTALGTDGVKSITVKAYDEFGNESAADVTVTLDTAAPAVSGVKVNGADLSGGATFYTTQPSVTLVGATDAASTLTVAYGSTSVTAQGSFSIPVALTANADTAVTITAKDPAGNESAAYTVTLRQDTVAPVVTLQHMGTSGTGTLQIGYSVDEAVKNNGVQVAVTSSTGAPVFSGTYSDQTKSDVALSNLADDTYTVTVTATDRAGNQTIQTGTLVIDTTLPVVNATVNKVWTKDTANLTVTATQSGQPAADFQVAIKLNGGYVQYGQLSAQGTYSFELTTLADGANEVVAEVTGPSGTSSTTVTVNKDTVLPDATAATVSQSGNVQFTLTEPAKVTIQYQQDGGAWQSGYTSGATFLENSQSQQITLSSPGTYGFQLLLEDRAGNTRTVAVTGTVTINPPPVDNGGGGGGGGVVIVPPAPYIGVTVEKTLTKENTIVITVGATPNSTVIVTNGSQTIANLTVPASGSTTYTAALVEGTNTFVFTIKNTATLATMTVTRDSTAPVFTVATAAKEVTDATASLTVTTEKEAQVTINGQAVGTTDASGKLQTTVNLKLGANSFLVAVTDKAGNAAAAQTITITRKEAAPVTPPTPPVEPPTPPVQPPTPPVQPPTPPVQPPVQPPVLTDITGHWAAQQIQRLVTAGVISGMGDGTFQPEATVTRAQFAKLIVLALHLDLSEQATIDFADADQLPTWAQPYVATAVKAGLITGYEDHTFRAGDEISRLQMAVILSRALKLKGIDPAGGAKHFADQDQIPTWATSGIDAATAAGLINGFEDGSFRPADKATRAQAAVMILRLMDAQ